MLRFNFPLPDEYRRISSSFGWRKIQLGDIKTPIPQFHRGQDHPAPAGVPGKAAYKGYVSRIWTAPRAGNCLEITHNTCSANKVVVKTVYYHLSKVYTLLLRSVENEIIFEVGNTGLWTTGPHLHWGVKIGSQFIDPQVTLNNAALFD